MKILQLLDRGFFLLSMASPSSQCQIRLMCSLNGLFYQAFQLNLTLLLNVSVPLTPVAPLFFIHSFIFLCFLHGLHFLCVSLKYSYFYVFSANVILFSNISNWVITSTLMVVILIFMLMIPFIGKYELILKFKALYLVLQMHLLLNVPKTTQRIISKINACFFLMCMLHGPLYSR